MIKASLLCYAPCLITWRFFGFIGMLALFVNNDYTDVVKRREYGTSCTYDYPCLAFFDTLVLICPLTERKVAVYYRNVASEKIGKISHHLGSERYFGNEHKGCFPLF